MPRNRAIRKRIRAGQQRAREDGKVWGAKQKITDAQVREARRRIDAGEGSRAVAASYGVTKDALYKRFEALGL